MKRRDRWIDAEGAKKFCRCLFGEQSKRYEKALNRIHIFVRNKFVPSNLTQCCCD